MDERTTDVPSLQYIFTCLTVGLDVSIQNQIAVLLLMIIIFIVKFYCGSTRLWLVDLQHFDNFMTS